MRYTNRRLYFSFITKRVRGIHYEKMVGILPVSLQILERSGQKNQQIHSFPVPQPAAKFCPNPSSFRGDISKNVFQTHASIQGLNVYPRDAMLARVFATATCPDVRPSGRPSVTRRYCD